MMATEKERELLDLLLAGRLDEDGINRMIVEIQAERVDPHLLAHAKALFMEYKRVYRAFQQAAGAAGLAKDGNEALFQEFVRQWAEEWRKSEGPV